jgi:hypothetical protein
MKHSLPILVAAAMLAPTEGLDHSVSRNSPPVDAAASGEALIRQVAQRMNAQPALQTQLQQHVDLFEQRLSCTGIYRQKASARGLLVRLDWQVQVGERTASVQHIRNGRFLWVRRDLLADPAWERVDLERARAALSQQPLHAPPAFLANDLAILGLPHLLERLVHFYRFDTPRAARLGDQPVWVIEGHWNPPEKAPEPPDSRSKSHQAWLTQLPTHVRVVVSQQDLALRRVEYLGVASDRRATNVDDADVLLRTISVLEISGASPLEDLDEGLFLPPADVQQVVDHTQQFLRYIRPRTSN